MRSNRDSLHFSLGSLPVSYSIRPPATAGSKNRSPMQSHGAVAWHQQAMADVNRRAHVFMRCTMNTIRTLSNHPHQAKFRGPCREVPHKTFLAKELAPIRVWLQDIQAVASGSYLATVEHGVVTTCSLSDIEPHGLIQQQVTHTHAQIHFEARVNAIVGDSAF